MMDRIGSRTMVQNGVKKKVKKGAARGANEVTLARSRARVWVNHEG